MWFEATDLDALIGGGCSVVCVPASLLAASWGLPIVSYACVSDRLSDKEQYSTFARVVGPFYQVNLITEALLEMFGWDCVSIISDKINVYYDQTKKLEYRLKARGKSHKILQSYFRNGSFTPGSCYVYDAHLPICKESVFHCTGHHMWYRSV